MSSYKHVSDLVSFNIYASLMQRVSTYYYSYYLMCSLMSLVRKPVTQWPAGTQYNAILSSGRLRFIRQYLHQGVQYRRLRLVRRYLRQEVRSRCIRLVHQHLYQGVWYRILRLVHLRVHRHLLPHYWLQNLHTGIGSVHKKTVTFYLQLCDMCLPTVLYQSLLLLTPLHRSLHHPHQYTTSNIYFWA